MDARRLKRLTKLVEVQRQIQALHETRHASHIASSNAADREARELVERFDAGTTMTSLFPDLYHQRISKAFATRDEHQDMAEKEAKHVISATLRADRTDNTRRQAGKALDEKTEEQQRLELAARGNRSAK